MIQKFIQYEWDSLGKVSLPTASNMTKVFDFKYLLRRKMLSMMIDSSMSLLRSIVDNLLKKMSAKMLAPHKVTSIKKHQQNDWNLTRDLRANLGHGDFLDSREMDNEHTLNYTTPLSQYFADNGPVFPSIVAYLSFWRAKQIANWPVAAQRATIRLSSILESILWHLRSTSSVQMVETVHKITKSSTELTKQPVETRYLLGNNWKIQI